MTENTTNNTQELSQKEKQRARERAWYQANKQKAASKQKAWRETNKEKTAALLKAWRLNNKEQYAALNKTWKENNKEKIKVQQSEWFQKNKEKVYINKQIRHKTNPLAKAKDLLRGSVYKAFLRIKQSKPTDTLTLLGCTWEEAKSHIESLFQEGMYWENHGEWHIDHIRPVSSFTEKDMHLMNHISNLQPLWAEDNLLKSDNWMH